MSDMVPINKNKQTIELLYCLKDESEPGQLLLKLDLVVRPLWDEEDRDWPSLNNIVDWYSWDWRNLEKIENNFICDLKKLL